MTAGRSRELPEARRVVSRNSSHVVDESSQPDSAGVTAQWKVCSMKHRKKVVLPVVALICVVASCADGLLALGDVNGDGAANLGDPVATLQFLFAGEEEPPGCMDSNGDGDVNIADPVLLLSWMYLGGPPPAC